jgi:hypothetical protein
MAPDPNAPTDSDKDNQDGKQKGNPDPNVKALQQKLTEKDRLLKETQEKLDKIEREKGKKTEEEKSEIQKLTEKVANLTGQITTINAESEKAKLAEKFPDILPEFLLGRSTEEQELIVEKQRKKIMENYDAKPSAHAPTFTSRGDVDKEMKKITEDSTLKTEAKMVKIRELKQIREKM